ncbi:MAG: hypothetical protein KA436_08175 [Oligoflexales bacterium]|nr:hypothetical protein [Oligoflexales bacterium]
MVSSKDKGVSPKALESPPNGKVLSNQKLSQLPKYISYKAALLREKLILSYVVMIISCMFVAYFAVSRLEIARLYEQLRTKEYILAPGIRDFTPVSPQSIPDSYVHDAVSDFVSSLGNINASNILEEYSGLKRFMSDTFKIKFEVETKEWVKQVQNEDLAQLVNLKNKEIISDQKGAYHVTAFVRADFYAAGQHLGYEDQAIEMELKLVPPDRDKRWYLQIENLTWSKLETFKSKNDRKKTDPLEEKR